MTPEQITEKFGADALNKLYDVIFDRPVHEMADWILSYYDEKGIREWLTQLTFDAMQEE